MLIVRYIALLALGVSLHGAEPLTLKLFDVPPAQPAPVSAASAKLIASYGKPSASHVMDVSDPSITVFKPEKPNGTVVIVAPGGGYMFLSYVHEGS